jgi:hypothetical protein
MTTPGGSVGRTTRISANVIETVFAGRVTRDMIASACASYRSLGGRSRWVIAAEETRSYAPDAVEQAVKDFAALHREAGLDEIIAIIVAPLVRMGASIVSASLRSIGSSLAIHVVDSRREAEARLPA